MLVDGLDFSDNSAITNIKAEPVTTLPTTKLRDGRIVALTQPDGAFTNGLYCCLAGTWLPLTAKTYVDSQIAANRIYDIASGVTSKPAASAVVMTLKTARAFTIPANFAGSQSTCGTVGTVSASVFTIKKNGTQVGTFSFAVSASTATFSTQSSISFAIGDILTVVAPATQNAALADIYWTIATSLT